MAKVVNICDVCKEIFAGGDAPKNNMSLEKTTKFTIPIYSNGEANDGLYGFTDFARVTEPSITISARGTIGYTSIRTKPFVPIVRLITIVPRQDVINIKYLYYATQNYNFGGSGTSIQQLTVPTLKKYNFPLPNLEEQEQIVSTLDKICDLISDRKHQLLQLDKLVKSRFIEMFGEPLVNDKGYPTKIGKSLFAFSSGKFLCEEKRKEKGVPVYGGNGIAWYTDDALIEYPTIIIGRVGAYCGNVKMIKEPVWITDNAIYIKEFKTAEFNLDYLYMLMIYLNFSQYADFSGQPKVTQKPLENVQYIIPPIELQKEFATFVEQTDKLKFEVKQSLEQLETLKKSLMQQYFG